MGLDNHEENVGNVGIELCGSHGASCGFDEKRLRCLRRFG
jgi:hypothetical protein